MHLVPSNLANTGWPQYEALSYVWGVEYSTRKVTVNGNAMQITENLDCALRHLRYTAAKRYLWIDALSMSQEDTQERNYQVRIMGNVYSSAFGVLVWLGPVDKSDRALRVLLAEMQFQFSSQAPLQISTNTLVAFFEHVCSIITLLEGSDDQAQDPQSHALDALQRIVGRAWFSQVWLRFPGSRQYASALMFFQGNRSNTS